MPNGKKTYVSSFQADDPLRQELNSYWIADEFALEVLGPPTLMTAMYSAPKIEEDAASFYKITQRITVTKNAAFDSSQNLFGGATTKGIAESLNIKPGNGAISKMPSAGQATVTAADLGAVSGIGASFASKDVADVAGHGLSFDKYFETNFFNYFLERSTESTAAEDIVFETTTPIVTKDYSTTSDPSMGKEEVKEEFLINFLEKRFEDAIAPPNVSELSIPNFYDTVNFVISENSFLNNYVDNLPAANKKYENVMFPADNYEGLQSLNGYGVRYPLEVRLSPSNNTFRNPSDISKALQDSSLDCVFFENVAFAGSAAAAVIVNKTFQKNNLKVENPIDSSTTTDAVLETSTVTLESMNAITFGRNISSFTEGKRTEFAGLGDATYSGPTVLSTDMANGNVTSLQEILASAVFLGKLKDVVKNSLRTFQNINMGRKSYSEIVLYKIEKYPSFESATPVQSFWIPNIASESPLEYIDTQVKYNKQYYYRVFAYSAVIGTKYYYDLSTLAATFESSAQQAQEDLDDADDAIKKAELEYFRLLNLRKDYENLIKSVAVHYATSWDPSNYHLIDNPTMDDMIAIYELQINDIVNNYNSNRAASTDGGYNVVEKFTVLEDSPNYKSGDRPETGELFTLAREYYPVRDSMYNGYDHGDVLRAYEAWQKAVDDKNAVEKEKSPFSFIWKTVPPDINTPLGASEHFEVDVISMPCVQFIKTNLFDFNGSILDDPPMIPQVNFTSYIKVDNEITINMNAQVGEYRNYPVILSISDSDYIDTLRNSRGLSPDSMINYKTDDETSGFQIYRIDTHPSFYEDFSTGPLGFVSTQTSNNNRTIFSWSASFKDAITPNRVYYYMIRSADIHGHLSYPSPVYKVQMVNDSGAIYPLIEVVELSPPREPKMKMKEFKKFMQLVPKLAHKMVDYAQSGLLDSEGSLLRSPEGFDNSINLGVVEPKLFGKDTAGRKFKIRLTSKQTGKKIDLNVTFKVENVKNEM